MSNENYMEIYKQLSFGQDKHTYFQLTVSMASIGFAITQTQNIPLNITQAPLGFAILAWAISFHCGLKNRAYYLSTLYANADLFKITQGLHPNVGQNPRLIQAATEGTYSAIAA